MYPNLVILMGPSCIWVLRLVLKEVLSKRKSREMKKGGGSRSVKNDLNQEEEAKNQQNLVEKLLAP
jgi:hypothetical protein